MGGRDLAIRGASCRGCNSSGERRDESDGRVLDESKRSERQWGKNVSQPAKRIRPRSLRNPIFLNEPIRLLNPGCLQKELDSRE